MKLIVGTTDVVKYFAREPPTVTVETDGVLKELRLDDLRSPNSRTKALLEKAREVIVGYIDYPDVAFLEFTPHALSVDIMAWIPDLSGIRHLRCVEDLSIQRPVSRITGLSGLVTLRKVYFGNWCPGTEDVFNLPEIREARFTKYPYPDLVRAENWNSLELLWVYYGKLERLDGIPPTVEEARVTDQRRLSSITALGDCDRLLKLYLEGCRSVNHLRGLERCRLLKQLSLVRCGKIEDLDPLADMAELEFLAVADRTVVTGSVEAVYTLKNLKRLIVTRSSGVDPDRMRLSVPGCETMLAPD